MTIKAEVRTIDRESKEYKEYDKLYDQYLESKKRSRSLEIDFDEEEPEEPKVYKYVETYFLESNLKEHLSHFVIDAEEKGIITLCFLDHSYMFVKSNTALLNQLKSL